MGAMDLVWKFTAPFRNGGRISLSLPSVRSQFSHILLSPVGDDRIGGFPQPCAVATQTLQFNRRKILDSIRRWRTEWFKQTGGDQDGNFTDRKPQVPRGFLRVHACWGLSQIQKLATVWIHRVISLGFITSRDDVWQVRLNQNHKWRCQYYLVLLSSPK